MKKITVDYHGVLSTYPEMFKWLSLEYKIYIVTGTSVDKADCIWKVINDNQIICEKLVTMPVLTDKPACFWLFANEWKLRQIEKINPDFHYDDEEYMTREIYKRRSKKFKTTPVLIQGPELLLDEAKGDLTVWNAYKKRKDVREIVDGLKS